jgi:ATP adenylyltransferase
MDKQYLYSPWRINYILGEKDRGCIFCLKPVSDDDGKHLIVHRSQHCYVILNLYPYNNGHVMVVPYLHVRRLSQLPKEVLMDLFSTVQRTETILDKVYHCEGMNIGINTGKAAGAGIDEHLHIHLVPRWVGDVNFMTVIGGERVIPEGFDAAYAKLKAAFAAVQSEEGANE